MSVYRLVCQTRTLTDRDGVEWEDRRYILQEQMPPGGLWKTLPVVNWNDLSFSQQEEALEAQGMEKTEHGYWRPKKK